MAVMRFSHDPQPGFFKTRLVKGGPWVPALIYRPCPIDPSTGVHVDRHYHLEARIGERPASVDHVWMTCRPIPRRDWLYMSDLSAWAGLYEPEAPEANPFDSVDLDTLPPSF